VPSWVRTYGAVVLIIVLTAALSVWSMVWLRSVSPHGPGPIMVQPVFGATPSADPIQTIPVLPLPTFSPSSSVVPVLSPRHARRSSRPPTSHPSTARPPSVAQATVTAVYATGASWDTGFIGSVLVRNAGTTPISWTVAIRYARGDGVRVGQAWNATVQSHGDSADFQGSLAAGGSVTFGFETTKRTPGRVRPVSCSVNGVACGMS
jgi:hypothetical protein